jgi:hypothetical protein
VRTEPRMTIMVDIIRKTLTALIALGGVFAAVACQGGAADPAVTPAAAVAGEVLAAREPLTTDSQSPVAHDTEIDALTAHSGRLFAATDQWEYQGPSAYGQVLVKDSASSPWRVFEQTQSERVQAIDSFAIPADQGLGPGHSLLITQAIVNGRSELQWLLDGASSFSPANSFALASPATDVRSFGAHESGGTWSVYAGANPTGILRGKWSKTRHTLMFSSAPELTAAPPGSIGAKTQKVTAFADCGGALYVTINTNLYRRNDRALLPGEARWEPVYTEPPVGLFNSGLRGLSCIAHDGAPALLLSTEGTGDVYRLDHLPPGVLTGTKPPRSGQTAAGLTLTLEFSPIPAIRRMLAADGVHVPPSGRGSVSYVIAAYNEFTTINTAAGARQAFGFEWGYQGSCPATRTCGPTSFGLDNFDAAACFAIRADTGSQAGYAVRCLNGPDFTPARPGSLGQGKPIGPGQAFVSIRSITLSPFGDNRIYFSGYDCNFYPADGTAWIASSALSAAQLTTPEGK